MINALRLYARIVGLSFRGQMQYRASFMLMAIGNLAITVIDFVGIWALFARFGALKGWRLPEVALFYGIVSMAFALAENLGRGFDTFPNLVRSGEFDRFLVRPRSTVLQVAASQIQLMRVGRLAQGAAVTLYAAHALGFLNPMALAHILTAVAGGVCMFYGLFIIYATVSFWTIDSLEIFNVLTYGGTEAGSFPINLYKDWFRRFFTFIVPLATVSYFPALPLLGRADEVFGSPRWFQTVSPVMGVLFLCAALQLWRLGVRHYRSTGS